MNPPPADPLVAERMRTAADHACRMLGLHPDPSTRQEWGWRGRTLSLAVTTADGQAWLRVACAQEGQISRTFWGGAIEAQEHIPAEVPRPRLREVCDWDHQIWHFRAELYDRVKAHPISRRPALTADPGLSAEWWTALRVTLADLAPITTSRRTIEQQYIDWAIPVFLKSDIDTKVGGWATAHGDLHWANICAPELHILDWEGWGLAPVGYDAAMLHAYSLLVPDIAERVRIEFAHVLDTPGGRFAQLVVITELLHSTTRGDNLTLAEPLRQWADHLLA